MKTQSLTGCHRFFMLTLNTFSSLALIVVFVFTGCKKETGVGMNQCMPNITTATEPAELTVAETSATESGALISAGNIDEKKIVLEKLGVNLTRHAIVLESSFTEDKGYEKWVADGYKVLLNINYGHVRGSNGKKEPVPFPTDMTEYRYAIETLLDKYHPEVVVIENEETTDQFHSGPIEDYITELEVAVDVCKTRGIQVANGGINVQYVQEIMKGNIRTANIAETDKLIKAFKTMDLDYVNVHTHAPFYVFDDPDVYAPGVLESVADYLRQQTGKNVMCNEYNQRNDSPDLIISAVNAFKAGGYRYLIPRSDSNNDRTFPLSIGTQLTPMGIAYRDAIK